MRSFFRIDTRRFAVLALASASTLSYGQAVSQNGGSIQGTITDPSGAEVPDAQVTISSPETGYTHTLTTDKAGYYSLGPLTPGSYLISVSAPSFEGLRVSTVVRTGTVTPGSEKLTLGQASETIEVSAGELQINTDQIGVSGVVTKQQIETLPINGRNILDIAQLQPGVILQSGESFDPTKAGYSALSVSGVGGRTTRILLDGQDITDETVGTTLFNVPSGAIDELQLNRSTQDVSGEVTSTGQVLVSTTSGTNAFHGTSFYNFQDNSVGFGNVNGVDAPFQRNQFGGYIGGPIIKDKLFFFGGAERILQHEEDAAQSPDPNFNSITSQYPFIPAPFKDTYSTGRLDYNGPRGIHLFARGTYSVNFDEATFGFTPYSVYTNRDNVPALVGGADFTTGKFTHSFRGGYEKFHNILGDATGAAGNSIYNPSTGPDNQVTLYGSFFAGPNYLAPQETYQSDKQLRYDGTWTRSSHTVKFGGELNRIQNGGSAEFFGASLFTYLIDTPSLQVGPGTNPYTDFVAYEYILGNGNSLFSERPGFGLSGGDNPSWRFAAYAADTWKVKPYLTLTAGLRWSVDTDRANQDLPTPTCAEVDPSLQFPGCTGNTPLFDQYQVGLGKRTHQPYGNYSPQAGFVFSPGSHKTSIRGGIGLFYESDIFNNTGNARGEVITANGAYQNSGTLHVGSNFVNLPGYKDPITGTSKVMQVNGVPISTISTEAISVAAPQVNALKAQYQAQVQGSISANPSFIGTGDGLKANNIYGAPYVSPYSIQINGGVQQELAKGLILSVDYVHNATIKVPLTTDVNHVGAARTLNKTAAQNAIATTVSNYASCPQGYTTASIDCAIANGATINSFAQNGLDSGAAYLGGYSASADGFTPDTGAAFAGVNPNVGQGLFILPQGRSGYDALQIVLQQQKSHPLPGILSSNLSVAYTLSRVVSNAGGASDQFFAGTQAWDNDQPDAYIGRNNLDHTNELSLGGSLGVKYGVLLGFIGHFYSAPPSNLTLDSTAGSTGAIFTSDVTGDGTTGDLVQGTLPGYYEHQVKGASLNKLINLYNATNAGQPTPAGTALINAGLFTAAELSASGGVQQQIAAAPTTPLSNAAFRTFDLNVSYPIKLARYHEGLSVTPGVAMYNVFNVSNFGRIPNSVLLNVADAGTPNYLNGPNSQTVLNSNRIERGSGTFDSGGPRTTEFQLKLNF